MQYIKNSMHPTDYRNLLAKIEADIFAQFPVYYVNYKYFRYYHAEVDMKVVYWLVVRNVKLVVSVRIPVKFVAFSFSNKYHWKRCGDFLPVA